MLVVSRQAFDQLVALAYDRYPEEACGLIAGPPGDATAVEFYPCRNVAASARVYTIDPKDHLLAERDADDRDWRSSASSTATRTPSRTRARPTWRRPRIRRGTT